MKLENFSILLSFPGEYFGVITCRRHTSVTHFFPLSFSTGRRTQKASGAIPHFSLYSFTSSAFSNLKSRRVLSMRTENEQLQ